MKYRVVQAQATRVVLAFWLWASPLAVAYGQEAQTQETPDPTVDTAGIRFDLEDDVDESGRLVMYYDPKLKVTPWVILGGSPLVPGGLPAAVDFLRFVESDLFASVFKAQKLGNVKVDGTRHDQVGEARELARAGKWERITIQPSTPEKPNPEANYASMAFGSKRDARGFRVKDQVEYLGKDPMEVWRLKLTYNTIEIPLKCGNVGLKYPLFKVEAPQQLPPQVVEKIVERQVEVPKIVEKIEYRDCPPCDPEWSWRVVAQYPASMDSKNGLYGKEVKFTREFVNGLLRVPDARDAKMQENITRFRERGAGMILMEAPEMIDKKIRAVVILYNPCIDEVVFFWFKDKWWSWKSFFIGGGVFGPVGFGLGLLLKDCPKEIIQKLPFFNPGIGGRPMTLVEWKDQIEKAKSLISGKRRGASEGDLEGFTRQKVNDSNHGRRVVRN